MSKSLKNSVRGKVRAIEPYLPSGGGYHEEVEQEDGHEEQANHVICYGKIQRVSQIENCSPMKHSVRRKVAAIEIQLQSGGGYHEEVEQEDGQEEQVNHVI